MCFSEGAYTHRENHDPGANGFSDAESETYNEMLAEDGEDEILEDDDSDPDEFPQPFWDLHQAGTTELETVFPDMETVFPDNDDPM